jgi:hypothetical protein
VLTSCTGDCDRAAAELVAAGPADPARVDLLLRVDAAAGQLDEGLAHQGRIEAELAGEGLGHLPAVRLVPLYVQRRAGGQVPAVQQPGSIRRSSAPIRIIDQP